MYDLCAAALRGKKNAMLNPVFLNKNVDNNQLSQVGDKTIAMRTLTCISCLFGEWGGINVELQRCVLHFDVKTFLWQKWG